MGGIAHSWTATCLYAGTVCVAERLTWAQGWWAQLRGLMGYNIAPTDALVLPGCSQVHTAFVAYPLVIAFCRAEPGWSPGSALLRVLAVQTLPPWRVGAYVRGATIAIEMRAGGALSAVAVGDLLTLR